MLTKSDEGKIVYFLKDLYIGERNPFISFGVIDYVYEYDRKAVVDYITHKDLRIINGIPIKEFNGTPFKKLPNGWDYDMRLFKEEYEELPDIYSSIDIRNPNSLLYYLDQGLLIRENDSHDRSEILSEIKKGEFRVYKKFKAHDITHMTYDFDELFFSWEDAQNKRNEIINERKRVANLSDEEWSIELIKRTVIHWANINKKGDAEVWIERAMRRFMEFKDLENLEARCVGVGLQWKYSNKKRWNNLNLEE